MILSVAIVVGFKKEIRENARNTVKALLNLSCSWTTIKLTLTMYHKLMPTQRENLLMENISSVGF